MPSKSVRISSTHKTRRGFHCKRATARASKSVSSSSKPLLSSGRLRRPSVRWLAVDVPPNESADASESNFSRLHFLANIIRAHSKQYKTGDQSRDTLVIGGDLLISKTSGYRSENPHAGSVSQREGKEVSPGRVASEADTITIEKINYKCEVLREHSKNCSCSTPRLHVYLTTSHRCGDTCSVNTAANIGVSHPIHTTTKTQGEHPDNAHALSSDSSDSAMTGKTRAKTKARKPSVKVPRVRGARSGAPKSVSAAGPDKAVLARNRQLDAAMTSMSRAEEPESELLVEEECDSLPTIMSTLSGGVEYIVLDDDALNLTKDGVTSSDVLKTKLETILEDIDEKPDIRACEARTMVTREMRSQMSESTSSSTVRSFARMMDVEKKEESVEVKIESSAGSNTLAGVCTNRCPSIKDIFGDVSIKEEPLDMGSNNDMTIDDFSKEISKLSDSKMILPDCTKGEEKPGEGNSEIWNNGIFAGLIKEETHTGDEVDIDTHGSDDSLGPLQIDEGEHDDSPNKDGGADHQMPSVNIISPFKIKILLGSPRHEALQEQASTGPAVSPPKPSSARPKRNGTATTKRGRKCQKKSVNNTKDLSAGSSTASEGPGSFVIKSLKCAYCQVESPDVQALAQHFEDHQKDGIIICYVCQKSFADRNSLKRHMRTHTRVNSNLSTAPEGSGSFTIKSLKCFYCHVESPDIQALAKHFDDHQKDGLIICYFCQRSFGDKTGLKRHMRTHTGEKPYQCKICGKRFSLPGNFKKHRDIHEDRRTEPCEICGKTFRRKEHLKYHMRTHTGEKPYTCSECGTSFTARYSLQIHMNIHLGKKPYKCTYCSKAFSDKSTMRKHVRIHTGEKPFSCEQCGRCFGESGTLAAHMATHRSERPFKCDKCHLSFKTTGGLRQHEKIHTGEKQFACKFCGMKFLQKYNMTMHERIHTGEKPYTCSHCDRSFRSRSCLAKHIVLHGGDEERRYHCDHCSSRFYRKAHLRRHIDMHLGIKNYECHECLKKFCTKGTLKSHLKTFHSNGARRFPCNWCGRVFKRKIYVSTHECLKYPVRKGEQQDGANDEADSSGAAQGLNASESEHSGLDVVKSEPEEEVVEDDDDDEDDDEDDEDDDSDEDDDEDDDEDEDEDEDGDGEEYDDDIRIDMEVEEGGKSQNRHKKSSEGAAS
ncbi:zinc finger protein 888-like [Penaeus indicus]|uniref:zinc finger protein 888-like n=1 Tax=Penaeus indicus TaxID=29960 RepID=UPI00300DB5F4